MKRTKTGRMTSVQMVAPRDFERTPNARRLALYEQVAALHKQLSKMAAVDPKRTFSMGGVSTTPRLAAEHAVQRKDDLEDDEGDDIPLDAQRVVGADQVDERALGAGR